MRFRRKKELRDHASETLSRARRGAARGLESAAAIVDEGDAPKRRRRKPLLLAALAGIGGWVVLRAKGSAQHADELVEEEDKAGEPKSEPDPADPQPERVYSRARQTTKSGNASAQ